MDGRSTSASTHVYAVFMILPLSHSSLLRRSLKFIRMHYWFLGLCVSLKKAFIVNNFNLTLYALLVFWPLSLSFEPGFHVVLSFHYVHRISMKCMYRALSLLTLMTILCVTSHYCPGSQRPKNQ